MRKRTLTPGKYTGLLIIILLLAAMDVLLHKGITRVLLPASFTDQRRPVHLSVCEQPLLSNGKEWVKAVNTIAAIEKLPGQTAGIEMDVYFDTLKNQLLVYHDSAHYATTGIEKLLLKYNERKLSAAVWLDFKNLSPQNQGASFRYVSFLRWQYQLNKKIIVESSRADLLPLFCRAGFFTSYYVPFCNPYQLPEKEIASYIDSVAANLRQYAPSAVSGYYFQYPLLRKFFPTVPVLLWTDKPGISIVANLLNQKMLADTAVKAVLHPL